MLSKLRAENHQLDELLNAHAQYTNVITLRVSSMKRCPYCVRTLPFFSIIWQRLTANDESALKCSRCKSVISSNGGALWPDALIASVIGFIISELLRDMSMKTIAISLSVAALVFIISSYFTAPIRSS